MSEPAEVSPTFSVSNENPFTQGVFRPLTAERTVFDLPVEGSVPPELSGVYMRQSFNPTPITAGPTHLFLGDGMIHGVEIRAGRPQWYRNRWVNTEVLAKKLGRLGPGGPPDVAFGNNPANTHIISHAGHLLALCEVGLPHLLDRDLNTLGRHDFEGRLHSPFTAHPKLDPVTGEMFGFGYSPRPPFLQFYVLNAQGQLTRSEVINVKAPTYMHDFAVTEQHAIFLDLPVVMNISLARKGSMPYQWTPEYGARLGIMPKSGGNADVRWFEIPLCFIPHVMNAFDDGEYVVLRADRADTFGLNQTVGTRDIKMSPHEWRLNLKTGTVSECQLSDIVSALPRVDERRVGHSHRYGYAMQFPDGEASTLTVGLVKYDLKDGTHVLHDFGPGRVAAEPVFVPASSNAGEDEGWVMSFVYDHREDHSDLILLDATAFSDAPVATIHLPQRVPYGAHGNWIADPES